MLKPIGSARLNVTNGQRGPKRYAGRSLHPQFEGIASKLESRDIEFLMERRGVAPHLFRNALETVTLLLNPTPVIPGFAGMTV